MDEGKKNERGDCYKSGMTIREHFAAMAMQGLCANTAYGDTQAGFLAKWSVEQADALLAELAKTEVGG